MCKCDSNIDQQPAEVQSEKNHETTVVNDYIKEINQCETKVSEQFDKNLLTLSSGSLGVSLTFLSKNGNSLDLHFLYLSWICFGVTVVLSILSYFVTISGLTWHLNKTKAYFKPGSQSEYPDIDNNPFHRALYVMNWFSAVSFIIGLIFTGLFIKGGL